MIPQLGGILIESNQNPHNIKFKQTPMHDWEPWLYLPPSEKTIKILKKEVQATIAQMKEMGNFKVSNVFTVFYGQKVYGFKFLDNSEVYLDKP